MSVGVAEFATIGRLRCDAPGCSANIRAATLSSAYLRGLASRQGWAHLYWYDLCPDHVDLTLWVPSLDDIALAAAEVAERRRSPLNAAPLRP